VSTCGWLLSVLRAPLGTGVFPRRYTVSTTTSTTASGKHTTTVHQDQDHGHTHSGHGHGHGKGGSAAHTGATSSGRHADSGPVSNSDTSNRVGQVYAGANPYTVAGSCSTLAENGLNNHLGDLLELVHQSSVQEVVDHLGVGQFAARVRATDQLRRLYKAWQTAHYPGKCDNGTGCDECSSSGGGDYDEKDYVCWRERLDSSSSSSSSSSSKRSTRSSGQGLFCPELISVLERNCLSSATDQYCSRSLHEDTNSVAQGFQLT
jgi:hypothetical protein